MSDSGAEPVTDLDALSALAEPSRRALYDFVVRSVGWVSRDQAAEGTGLERGTVAHHLDRLAEDRLLEVDYRRLSGRTGPGAGRPAKVYRRADQEFGVSLPPRDYELASRLLADAVDAALAGDVPLVTALDEAARRRGHDLAREMSEQLGRSRGPDARSAVLETLERHGFEPHVDDVGVVSLHNCPFHRLARDHTGLVCGLNVGMLEVAVGDLADAGLDVRLEPAEGRCCVRLHPASDR